MLGSYYLVLEATLLGASIGLSQRNDFRDVDCDKTFLASRQPSWFASPNFPFNYTEKLECRYTFLVDRAFQGNRALCFQFRKFHLKWSDSCFDDHLHFEGRKPICGDGRMDGDSVFRPICVSLSDINKYEVVFRSRSFSSYPGFYAVSYISDDPSREFSSCDMDTKLPCLTGPLKCISKDELCGRQPKCPDGSDLLQSHAGCQRDVQRPLELISFEDTPFASPMSTSNWNLKGSRGSVPPYDHTTLSPDGHVMTTRGGSSSFATLSNRMVATDDPNRCLSFWYFIHRSVQSFAVRIVGEDGRRDRSVPVWQAGENMGFGWKKGEIQLDSHMGDSIQVQFESRQDSDASTSIDDVALLPGTCYGDDASCTFELNSCGWKLSKNFELTDELPKLDKFENHRPGRMAVARLAGSSEASLSSRPVTLRSAVSCLSFQVRFQQDFCPCEDGQKLCLLPDVIVLGVRYDGLEIEIISPRDVKIRRDWQTIQTTVDNKSFEGNIQIKIKFMTNGATDEVVVVVDHVTFTSEKCPPGPKEESPVATTFLPDVVKTTPLPRRSCFPQAFMCKSDHECIGGGMVCNGFIDCMDASDEMDCPKTGGPLRYSEPIQPSFLVAITVTVTILVVSIVSVLFFVVSKRVIMRARASPSRLTGDQPDGASHPPKPPPYSLHLPPYSGRPPMYTSHEEINLKAPPNYYPPPPPFTDSSV